MTQSQEKLGDTAVHEKIIQSAVTQAVEKIGRLGSLKNAFVNEQTLRHRLALWLNNGRNPTSRAFTHRTLTQGVSECF